MLSQMLFNQRPRRASLFSLNIRPTEKGTKLAVTVVHFWYDLSCAALFATACCLSQQQPEVLWVELNRGKVQRVWQHGVKHNTVCWAAFEKWDFCSVVISQHIVQRAAGLDVSIICNVQ